MEPPRLERKLAAILHADVKGYSRLIGEDEVGTLAHLGRLPREDERSGAAAWRPCSWPQM
jgi:hypothetical protein